MVARMLFLLLLCGIGCSHIKKTIVAVQGSPYSKSELSGPLGSEVYVNYCMRCHGEQGRGQGVDSNALTAALPNFSDGSFQKSLGLTMANIKYGKREEMPAFEGQLSEEELWSVAHFVRSVLSEKAVDSPTY